MRTIFICFATIIVLYSCGGAGNTTTAKTFCDTACNSDSIIFKSPHPAAPVVAIGISQCKGDTLFWAHNYANSKMVDLTEYLGAPVRLNKKAIACYFKDTTYAWLQFNDCSTGRGYALKLTYNKATERRIIKSALTRFDPKFIVDTSLIVYTDRGSVFVENIATGQTATMPFDKVYDIDFTKLHEMVDSVNISKSRLFVQMIRDGEKRTYEKAISL